MNGVVPMMSPVTGSRSGAPGGSVNSRTSADEAEEGEERVAQAALLGGRVVDGVGLVARSDAIGRVVPAATARAAARSIRSVMRAATSASTIDDDDAEPVVGDDRERRAAGRAEGLVGDLGDHRVDRAEDRVDPEDRADAGEAGRHARPAGAGRRS